MKKITVFKDGTNTDRKIFKVKSKQPELLALQISDPQPDVHQDPEEEQVENCACVDGISVFFQPNRTKLNKDMVYMYELDKEDLSVPESVMKKIPKTAPDSTTVEVHTKHVIELPVPVKLNVGGVMFETLNSTLKRDPNSRLAKIVGVADCKDCKHPDLKSLAKGVYFLDRDPKYFAPILDYLRTGSLTLDGLSPKRVIQEAVYFNIAACIPPNWEHCTDEEALAHFAAIKIS